MNLENGKWSNSVGPLSGPRPCYAGLAQQGKAGRPAYAPGHRVISFLDGKAGYNEFFMAEDDMSKTAFCCPNFIGLFKWVVMTFGLKNVSATYQSAINLIFHVLLGIILEIYIDNVIVKSDGVDSHLADSRLALERMRQYELKINMLKCTLSVSAGKFL
jgi:hypothetical protein